MMASPQRLHIFLVGHSGNGKSSLCDALVKKKFGQRCMTTDNETIFYNMEFDKTKVELIILDAGSHNLGRIPKIELKPHCFIICSAFNSLDVMANEESSWLPKVKRDYPTVPVIFAANKTDLRCDAINEYLFGKTMSMHKVMTVPRNIVAGNYFECSAKLNKGVYEVFEAAARAAMTFVDTEKKKECCGLF